MSKRFLAVWGNDYHEPGQREVGIEDFSEAFGYDPEVKPAIDALAVGDVWRATDGTNHTVTRLS